MMDQEAASAAVVSRQACMLPMSHGKQSIIQAGECTSWHGSGPQKGCMCLSGCRCQESHKRERRCRGEGLLVTAARLQSAATTAYLHWPHWPRSHHLSCWQRCCSPDQRPAGASTAQALLTALQVTQAHAGCCASDLAAVLWLKGMEQSLLSEHK